MIIEETIRAIKPIDMGVMKEAKQRWDSVAKPLGSLGLLEDAVIQIAGVTGTCKCDIKKRAVVVMCADNGVVAEGVTQCGSEVTAIVTENITKSQSCVCKMAELAGADVFPVDIGMNKDVAGTIRKKVAYGTKNMAREPAMTKEQALKAIETGVSLVRELKQSGYKIIATGEMGIGNTTTSSAIAAVLINKEINDVTGRGAGLSDVGLLKKRAAIAKAIEINSPDPNDPIDVLSKVGGFDIAGLCGIFLGGGVYHIPVLIDGFISAIAALIALRLAPNVGGYMMASHVSGEPAGRLILEMLGKKPMITAGMRLGEGTGAVAAMPLLDMAFAVYKSMCTFEEARFEAYKPL